MKLALLTFLILSLLACSLSIPSAKGNCGWKCANRCAKAGMRDRCLTYCGICCRKCNCVPSGTWGNKAECPCYRDMVNPKGKPKCP